MNICLVTYGFPDFVSADTNGISTYYFWNAKGLAERGHNVFILSPRWQGTPGQTVMENVRIWPLPLGNIHYYNSKIPVLKHGSFWMLHQEIGRSAKSVIKILAEKYGLDIVELYAPINLLWGSHAHKRELPIAVTMHGLPFSFKRDLQEPLRLMDYVGLRCYQFAMQKANCVICPSAFVVDEVRRMGISIDQTEYIPYPIPEEFVGYSDRLSIEPHFPTVLSLAPVNFPKGLDTLAAAIPIVKSKLPDIRFIHIGKLENPKIAKTIAQQDAGILHTPVAWPLVSAYHQASDLIVSASRFETVGYTLLEGMIHRKPVVATRVGGMTDLVVDGETGFLVAKDNPSELARGITQILANKPLADKMGQQGHARALEAFGMGEVMLQKIRLYERLKNRQKRGSLTTAQQVIN